MNWRLVTALSFGLFLGLATLLDAGTVYFVNDDATGLNTGGSWPNAWTNLQSALAAATSGDEIRVAQGVYKPGTSPEDSFELVDGVKLLGGFRGGNGGDANDRNIDTFVTILTGDLAGDDTSCLDDSHLADNAEHVVIADGITDPDTLLEGFTITHGAADRSPNAIFRDYGGGLVNNDVVSYSINECKFTCNRSKNAGGGVANLTNLGPIFTNCDFEYNGTGNQFGGGAVLQAGSNSTFTNCTFTFNTTDSFGLGGAICAFSTDQVVCINCQFEFNIAGAGGAVYAEGIAELARYTHCTFSNNEAEADGGAIFQNEVLRTEITGGGFDNNTSVYGGAIYSHIEDPDAETITITLASFTTNAAFYQGGALFNDGPTIFLRSTSFTDNESTTGDGGAILDNSHSPVIVDCQFISNTADGYGGAVNTTGFGSDPVVTLVNSRFLGNEAGEGFDGGGLYTINTNLDATNCLWADNHAGYDGGAVLCNSAASANFTNCTFADNIAAHDVGGMYGYGSNGTLKNCILWGNADAGGFTSTAQVTVDFTFAVTYSDVQGGVLSGTGNKSVNPLFVNASGDDYHLNRNSPCIDVGNTTGFPEDDFDVDGDTDDDWDSPVEVDT